MKQTKSLLNEVVVVRRGLFGLLGASVFLLGMPGALWAEKSGESHSGSDSGHGGGGGGGEGGGESGGGHGAGRTPSQRAVRHRQRKGRTLGGGETHGGGTSGNHDGGGGGGEIDQGTGTLPLQDGTTTGPVGGDSGGEHFIHEGLGDWSAGSKVLRGN